jgi:NADP-dependent 3-hydroxy acid dehydrogenase YdfG
VKTEWLNLKRTFKTDRSTYLTFDVRDKKPFQNIASLPEAFSTIDILINNAGNTWLRSYSKWWFRRLGCHDWHQRACCMFLKPSSTNDRNQVILSTSVPLLQKKFIKRKCILCYKTCGWRLNQGMRMDLNPFGIRVGAIHPGMVQTEFSEVL